MGVTAAAASLCVTAGATDAQPHFAPMKIKLPAHTSACNHQICIIDHKESVIVGCTSELPRRPVHHSIDTTNSVFFVVAPTLDGSDGCIPDTLVMVLPTLQFSAAGNPGHRPHQKPKPWTIICTSETQDSDVSEAADCHWCFRRVSATKSSQRSDRQRF